MPISIAPQYTQRNYTWIDWKEQLLNKRGIGQFDDNDIIYTIYFYDGPEVLLCSIWKNNVPEPIQINYSQAQNDLDKLDFETNYKNNFNQTISQVDRQRNSIYEANYSNYFSPSNAATNYYLGISYLNEDGYYRHSYSNNSTGIKIYGINCLVAKTNTNDIWIFNLGVITALEDTTATVNFLNPGSIYLSNNGISNSNFQSFQFPIYIDCTITNNQLTRTAGGIIYSNVPGVGSTIPITNAMGISVFPQVGDLIISVSSVSDVTGYTSVSPTGLGMFQYHFWYSVD